MVLPFNSFRSIPKTEVSIFIFDICITSNIFAVFPNLFCYFEDSVMILFNIGNDNEALLNVIHYPFFVLFSLKVLSLDEFTFLLGFPLMSFFFSNIFN